MEYLSAIDAAFVHMESARTPMHVGGLLTFRLPDDAGAHYLRDLFAFMRSQPVTAAPFCYRLRRGPLSHLAPAWETVDALDIDYHLRHSALPHPGGERELGVLVARLHSHPMDMSRPLWECHLIEGLENRRFALYLKAHHAALDGMAALRMIKNWLSTDPSARNPAGPWAMPATRTRTADASSGSSDGMLRQWLGLAREQTRALRELAAALRRMTRRSENPEGGLLSAFATPRSLFNAPVTPHRRLATQLLELRRFKALSAATGATINDLALAICGAAMRRYLLDLDALPDKSLIASIPVGLSRAEDRSGNAVAGFVCPLGTDIDDPLERLRRIHAITQRTKQQLGDLSAHALSQFTLLGMSPLLLGQMTGTLATLPPIFNVIVSNVVGARDKLYFRGAELEAMYPVSVLFDGYALNITIVGYADRLAMGFTGCRNTVPSLQRLAVYTGEALTELEQAVAKKRPASPHKTRSTRRPRRKKTSA